MSPIYVPGKVVLRKTWQPMDADAAAYITAVETADGQALEEKVKIAIDNFVLGCKADGIWSAIKASCILAGARTLGGCLVPLVGAAPANFNFVSGDYNRKTGLVGDGSTKYLNSNRNNNADPQDSKHLTVYIQATGSAPCAYINSTDAQSRITRRADVPTDLIVRVNDSGAPQLSNGGVATGFVGVNRSSSANTTARFSNSSIVVSAVSLSPSSSPILVNGGTGRLAFYSIGESLDLAKLDARVTDLINAFGVAIP